MNIPTQALNVTSNGLSARRKLGALRAHVLRKDELAEVVVEYQRLEVPERAQLLHLQVFGVGKIGRFLVGCECFDG